VGRAVLERQHDLFSQRGCTRSFRIGAFVRALLNSQSLPITIAPYRVADCRRAADSLLQGSLAESAQGEIQIEPRVGFHGVFQLGRPFPLELELNNSGLPAEGVLQVQVWKGGATKGGAPFAVNYRREVFLAAQARKTIQLTVDPDFISRPLTITFASRAGGAKRELDLRRYFSPTPLLLVLSESSLLPAIATVTGQNRLIALSPGELAADPRALLGVSHVILYDQSLRDLSRAQLAALDTWLSSGGRMVIIGSLNFALYQDAALSRFLPVRVSGTRRITFKPSAGKGEPLVSLGGVWALQSTLVNGKVLAESDGLPVLVEASRGRDGLLISLWISVVRRWRSGMGWRNICKRWWRRLALRISRCAASGTTRCLPS
jgi:hypothetical protein